MPAAARLTDLHVCQAHPGSTPLVTAARSVNIGFQPAARVGDHAACPGGAAVAAGSTNVFIEGAPAARLGDRTRPTGAVLTGCATVNIGTTPEIDALLAAAKSGTPFLDCKSCRMDGEP